MSEATSSSDQRKKVTEMIKDVRIAMLTHVGSDGQLYSQPMATQEVEFDGDVMFIAHRDSRTVQSLSEQPDAQVNVAYSGNGSWVSLSGKASVVDDVAKLKELWNTFTDAWMKGGPEDPNNILLRIDAESAEYWDSPGGNKVTQLANLAKTAVTGNPVEGDNQTVDL